MPSQNGAYLALSRKFCGQVNIIKIFSLVRQTRNTRADPVAMVKPAGSLVYGLRAAGGQQTSRWRRETAGGNGCKVVGTVGH